MSAIFLELPDSAPSDNRLFADIETLPSGNDLVMLTNGDRITGEFQQLDASFVAFERPFWGVEARSQPRTRDPHESGTDDEFSQVGASTDSHVDRRKPTHDHWYSD